MNTYKVSLGNGTRTVEANNVSEALEKATGREFSRFEQTDVNKYTDMAAAPGHRTVYTVKCTKWSRKGIPCDE